jgi:hypothetical protein
MKDVQQLPRIDQAKVTPMVRAATGNPVLDIGQWSCAQIQRGAGEGLGVYQLSGNGRAGAASLSWSLILKILDPAASDDPSAWNYGLREVLAYQSGLMPELPDGLGAPTCFGVEEQPDGTIWLWLEAIAEEEPVWTLAHYNCVARRLGCLNGIYLADRPLPDYPWLSKRWLHRWLEEGAMAVPQLPQFLDHPWVRRVYPPEVAEALLQIWAERELFLAALERLPQTLCHLDAFRRNLFNRRRADGKDETILIDWAFIGPAAVGEELVPLINASVAFLEVGLDQAQELEEEVLAGYLAGLQDVGCHIDPGQVRLGYAAAATLRYTLGTMRGLLPMLLDTSQHAILEQVFGRPMVELAEVWLECGRRFNIRLAAEARHTLGW